MSIGPIQTFVIGFPDNSLFEGRIAEELRRLSDVGQIRKNARRYDHQVLIHAAAITTPNDCSSVRATATTLRELEMRRNSLRSGGRGLPRSLRRSVGRTSGSASAGGTIVRCAGGLAIWVMSSCYIPRSP